MIESITLSECATFTGDPQRLDGLRQINYFFGLNGTGKTTIARVIKDPPGYPECSLTWGDDTPLTALVYNRDFVDANFRASPVIKGVFTLGEEHAETQERLEAAARQADKARKKAAGLREQLDGKRRDLSDARQQFESACWERKNEYADEFKEAMKGALGSKASFADRVLRVTESGEADVPDPVELRRRFSSVFDDNAEPVPLVGSLDGSELEAVEGESVLGRPIVGSADVPLAALIGRLGNSDWVKRGQEFLDEAEGLCPFCQQSEPEHLRDHLREYFDDSFERDLKAVRTAQERYQTAAALIETGAERLSEVAPRFLDVERVEAVRQRLLRKVASNRQALSAKVAEPSRKVDLESTADEITALNALVDGANQQIAAHNQMVANQETEREVVARKVWRLIGYELRHEVDRFRKASARLDGEAGRIDSLLGEAVNEEQRARMEVRACEKSMTGVGPTIEAINGMLESLGFTSFSLAPGPDPDTYKLVRADGTDAKDTLSEGERSFITFLYFYFLVEGSQDATGVSGDRVVIIDDPVSSLDGDVLFVVSTLVREIAKRVRDPESRIRQLFLLTHNVFFHREVSFSSRRDRDVPHSDEAFWKVRKRGGVSVVKRCDTNPVRTSYDLLWDPVRNPDDNLVGLQNAMRRILENYFRMVGQDLTSLEESLEGRDRIVCRSLLSWLHVGSHRAMDDLWVAPEDGIETHLRVFQEIFKLTGHGSHYEKMMGAEDTAEPDSN